LNGEQQTEAWAIYLDTAVELTDRLTLKVGGRYSYEERDGRQAFDLTILSPTGGADIRFAPEVQFFPNAVSDTRDGVMPDPFGFVVAPVIGPASFDSFTPKLGLDFRMKENVLFYASIQKGFKSGGYNIGSSQRVPFEPETIWAYEAGIKSDLADGRVRFSLAAFHYEYENLQAQDSIQNQPIIRNVGEAKVDGVEIETLAVIAGNFQVDASATYLDARFTKGELTEPLRPAPLTQAPGTVLRDLDGLRLPRAAEWKFNVGAQTRWAFRDMGEFILRADYGWQSKIYYTVFNIDAASQDSYGLLNARAQYTPGHGNWSIALFGKNLGDEEYFTNQILTGTFYGAEFVGSLGAPRTYGAEFRMRF
jgi:iron complex outermembrane receptor protein